MGKPPTGKPHTFLSGSTFLFFLLLLVMASISFSQPAETIPAYKNTREKIGPESAAVFINETTRGNREVKTQNIYVKILVETQQPGYLHRLLSQPDGLVSRLYHARALGGFFTATGSVANIRALSRKEWVKSVYVLDYPVPAPSGCRSPVLAIIDMHMDPASRIFIDPATGKSRVLHYWDQRQKPVSLSARRPPGHGWMTSAIATGNTALKDADGNILMGGYTPVCPLILVNTTGKTGDILDAVRFVTDKTRDLNTHVIIFLPFSTYSGPHTGEETYIKALETLLDNRYFMIVSAGNDGQNDIYWESPPISTPQPSSSSFPAIPFLLTWDSFSVEPGAEKKVELEFWFKKSNDFDVRLESPGGRVYGPVSPRQYRIINTGDEGTILVSNSLSHGSGEYGCLLLAFRNNRNMLPPPGIWQIRISLYRADPVFQFRGWVTWARGGRADFKSGALRSTVSTLAISDKIMSVGALQLREGRASISPYSNTVIDLSGKVKPDVLINGGVKVFHPELKFFLSMDSTSSASAIFTRFVQKFWAEHPLLTARQIRNLFKTKALVFQQNVQGKSIYPYKIIHPQQNFLDVQNPRHKASSKKGLGFRRQNEK